MAKLFLTDLQVRGKRVLVRADFNVPLQAGEITDDRRVRETLPTVRWLADNGARTILMSHMGRPKGQRVEELSLAPVARRLSQLLGREVPLAPDCIGAEVQGMVGGLGDGDVLLLENLRFHPGETKNDPEFSAALAAHGEMYVNDAFGASHRAHASIAGVAEKLSPRAMGFLLKKEVDFLGNAMASPERPAVAIIGGAKVSGKIEVMRALLSKMDTLLVGGGMAYTFFHAMGWEIGKSLLDQETVEEAGRVLEAARAEGSDRFVLPVDIVAADRFADDADTVTVAAGAIPADRQGLDIGPETARLYGQTIRNAKTVIWNGPMGVFEMPRFAVGTRAVADALAAATGAGATTVVGGGDSAAAIAAFGLTDQVSHVSTGGGASLELLEGKVLPGLDVLSDT
jgi:phosphoglycerate kinase